MTLSREKTFLLLCAILALLVGCETTQSTAPPVASFPANRRNNVAMLEHGRALFVQRCAECHTLPVVAN
jgi:mono/diheme cytochrome c family protein